MIKSALFSAIAITALGLSGCAPPGQGAIGFRDIDWPRADQQMTYSDNREIEVLLGALGYMQGGADGNITTSTRNAIRTYQRDIGAPITGYVSLPLLQSLRINAPAASSQAATLKQPTAASAPVSSTQPIPTSRPASGTSGGSGAGGSGGSGGGVWN